MKIPRRCLWVLAAALLAAGTAGAQQAALPRTASAASAAAARKALDIAYPAPQGDFMGGRGFRGVTRPRNMKTVLIWADTRNGIAQHASTSHAAAVIEEMGYNTGAYFSYIRTDSNIISYHPKQTDGKPASGGPSLANVDAIFFLGHREVPIDAAQKAALLRFVHNGGGFVAAHVASTAFMSWPAFGQMLGGRFDRHPWGTTTAPVIVEDPSFPGMQFFPRVFQFHDEFYQIKDFSPAKSRVLMRLDTAGLNMKAPGVNPADAPYAITWARMYGKGRVFYSALGHDAATWDNPAIRRMWFNAIEWALGVENADVTPQPVSTTVPPPPVHHFFRRGRHPRASGGHGSLQNPGR
ncbi:MAG: ThuA domain-containing protein [Terriglobales bacterium]